MNQARRILKKGKRALPGLEAIKSLNWRIILTTAGVLVASLVVVLMHKKVYAILLRQNRFQVPMNQLRTASVTDWSDRVTKNVLKDVNGPPIDLFGEEAFESIKRRYEASPWVRRVERIEREGLKEVKLTVQLRRPAAAVSDGRGHWYLVDRYGVRLPGTYETPPSSYGTVYRITGFAGRPPAPGNRWSARPVRAASSLAYRLLSNEIDRQLDIRNIEVQGTVADWKNGEGELVFHTRRNVRVVWGGAADQRGPWEPAPDRKLKNLRMVLKGAPNLTGLEQVKLQFDDPVISLKKASVRSPHDQR